MVFELPAADSNYITKQESVRNRYGCCAPEGYVRVSKSELTAYQANAGNENTS